MPEQLFILILEDELRNGYLTGKEFDDYINLFRSAANKIFENEKHSEFWEEVDRMTKPLIELPSVRDKRLKAEMRIEMKDELEVEMKEKLAEKDAELFRLKELLIQYNIMEAS